MARMKRDRFLLAVTFTVILIVDIYFVLLPRLRAWYDLSRGGCYCNGFNGSADNNEQVSYKMIFSSNLVSLKGSQLKRLFGHPLYNIHLPDLIPEERLLEEEELMEYYRRKLNRWERWVHILISHSVNKVKCLFFVPNIPHCFWPYNIIIISKDMKTIYY